MEKITVALGERSYDIHVGVSLLDQLGERVTSLTSARRTCVVSDRTVYDLYGRRAEQSLKAAGFEVSRHVVSPGDQSKSLAVAGEVYDTLYEAQLDRSCPLIALGGGVVGDLTGFIAGTWLRGVPFVQVPTTLEADIDASVGGKTAVNHAHGKNLIGVFHQPLAVLMDTDTLATLSPRDVRAGLAESIKHAVIRDREFLELHEREAERILGLDGAVLEGLLIRNCRIKAEVVAADEREAGLREILNFGHTIGHAVETCAGYDRYRHGEAVALGMVGAGFIARELGRFDGDDLERIEAVLRKFELPTRFEDDFAIERLVELMKRDKKVRAGRIRFVLPVGIGEVKVFDDVSVELIGRALEYISSG